MSLNDAVGKTSDVASVPAAGLAKASRFFWERAARAQPKSTLATIVLNRQQNLREMHDDVR